VEVCNDCVDNIQGCNFHKDRSCDDGYKIVRGMTPS
jgi:hypothetical protein